MQNKDRNIKYEVVRNLPHDLLGSAWMTNLKKGDIIKFKEYSLVVTVRTEKTFRLKSKCTKIILSFKKYGVHKNVLMAEGKEANFLLDVEGLLTLDLLNEHNNLHKVSDFFKLTLDAVS